MSSYKKIVPFIVLVLLSGCDAKPSLDGKKLLEQKCSSCHNLDIPPYTDENETAPPMMAVSFHIFDLIEASDDSSRFYKSVDFVSDYILNPSVEKSFCDKKSLESYGLMPSQKGKVSEDEAEAIAKYMFKHFTKENLLKKQEELMAYTMLPAGQKIALKYNCLGCHSLDKDKVGPSFNSVYLKYQDNQDVIKESIKNGSRGKWENSRGVMMPKFNTISDKEIDTLIKWMQPKV